jgi:hypothetical protein
LRETNGEILKIVLFFIKEMQKLMIQFLSNPFQFICHKNLKTQYKHGGLYYKHVMIVNYTSIGINELKASLNDDAEVVIYYRRMFKVHAIGGKL